MLTSYLEQPGFELAKESGAGYALILWLTLDNNVPIITRRKPQTSFHPIGKKRKNVPHKKTGK